MRSDNAQMEISKKWKETYRTYNISSSTSEPHHPWQNPAERRIQEYGAVAQRGPVGQVPRIQTRQINSRNVPYTNIGPLERIPAIIFGLGKC